MHLHILGICGTFMGSLALLAREAGHRVSGSDAGVYPPMSTQLEQAGIVLTEGFAAENLEPAPDLVVIGNALSRGNPEVEAVLDRGLPYVSGPQWLAEHVLPGRRVIAVAGTHGKTTTASLTAWLLEAAGLAPGFLIGGVPRNFGVSARLGGADAPFVVEADEYDTAFFDKRSKFVHYRPEIAVLGNLEFDHADIFPDLAAIERQFHHLVRTVPGKGRLLVADGEPALERVLEQGRWTPVERFGTAPDSAWHLALERDDASRFRVVHRRDDGGEEVALVDWSLSGAYNARNAVAALAAAHACGVSLADGAEALARFATPRRRQELRGEVAGIQVIDDFAHHPTAIAATLGGLRASARQGRLLAVIEPRSNTMRLGTLRERLAGSVADADAAYWYQPAGLDWTLAPVVEASGRPGGVFDDLDGLVAALVAEARPGDRLVVMSNGGFGGIHEKLLAALEVAHGG
ncbi:MULTISPECIES: UDP-N-acetylmuramate:L-alanyl-gamma-D-glutamyl-meso-diaminopimelate ligase [Halomonas]|uniref:UDP-N-acetylmuramate--L-alanyl-gamma-D-glutamyl-meso-2,6-diaminoheptandioate ligase n=1 Tax=Halomonas halophila TaxID=29573 RepID=A0ABQ0U1G5_9GAMM|nr:MULTISPECIES: UDP-N-acetylmuramate:L-alanyl-gamma-D-glutamyl-meso-diaminopimelate ligase [Halomonas]MDR5888096.1 UDP-N-acetylmuramate:L-alanyl-gamma-D-glutamyl-meso-diaminopimelate ligase [Halomonas salina]RAH37379.1 UDP-N-acetylmuramate:L-alanyl-gamma-D-glutamyl-meso-diaminopimelate ligase [Halomonas sp. SL1]WJY08619.1 UDP-N-acetylmuramate:L-alanyl-gamma-D-glutamyl-meso-diaminopimelate ligase [Halomonas halophila]GEK72252.1 UDP-N-acetylmuramate--L-alanyl-gamma-D-glutamyl-meso-2,6-diaminohep